MTEAAFSLAQRIGARLGAVVGVRAVALGGSVARGEGRPDSDLDIDAYYRPEQRQYDATRHRCALVIHNRRPSHLVTEVRASCGAGPC